jgi:hypothetical protein
VPTTKTNAPHVPLGRLGGAGLRAQCLRLRATRLRFFARRFAKATAGNPSTGDRLSLMMEHAYPTDLARFVMARFDGARVSCRGDLLVRLLSVAYHASLLREEERPLSFRLLFASPDLLPLEEGPPHGNHRLRFDKPRRLDEQEIRRLAPAAKMQRALIGVAGETPEGLEIWGLVQTGPGWLHALQGGRARGAPLPDALLIAVTGPGRVSVSRGGVMIARLAAGKISGPRPDVFESKWLPDACADNRRDVLASHELGGSNGLPVAAAILRQLDQQLVRRVIANIGSSHHGGTLVILPREEAERVVAAGKPISLKYHFADEEPRRRYRSLQLLLLEALVEEAKSQACAPSWEMYTTSAAPALVAIDQALLELAHTIAGLADVDGAVVLNKGFEVIGFGGEIVGELPDVSQVVHALDPEGQLREQESTDRVGTRHRSLYRLCAAFPEAVGFVVSQDGSVRLVANKDGVVTYWDHLGSGP